MMNHAKLFTCYLIFSNAGLVAVAKPSAARKKPQDGYVGCREDALANAQKANLAHDQQVEALRQCLVRFPNAAIYNDCKLQVVKKYGKDPAKAREKLKTCQQIRTATEYSDKQVVPYFRVGERQFFAGADLSYEVNFENIKKLPNFNCQSLDDVLTEFTEPEYVMFGNTPALFQPLATVPRQKLLRGSKMTIPKVANKARMVKGAKPAVIPPSYGDIKKLGRLYLDPTKKSDQLFFPLAHCAFSGNLGATFEDHKIYYLINVIDKKVVPYFGASFYRHLIGNGAEQIKLETIVALVKRRLGANFSEHRLASGNILISEEPPAEFDSDGDPKNLCKTPRTLSTVALIRSNPRTSLHAGAVFMVNVKNLCQFGDQLAADWIAALK